MRLFLCSSKMAEDSQQREEGLILPPSTRNQPGSEDISGAHFQQAVPSQLTREKLYQQRQKCELRRLLKHTHPELKMLDDVVDEELAEVLSSETGATTVETGYEGEVLSRRLIFENCSLSDKVSPYIPKRHMPEETVERGDISKISAVFEEHEERSFSESVKESVEDEKTLGCSPDHNTECEENMVRIDVQATRRLFESQSVNTSLLNPGIKPRGKASISGDEPGAVQKRIQEHPHCKNKSNACAKSLDLTDLPQKLEPCAGIFGQSTNHDVPDREECSTSEGFEDEPTSLCDPEKNEEIIKTSPALLKNNPFIQTNIERELSFMHTSESQSQVKDSAAAQDYPVANVKNRAHLFESMPFDKIRHQNKDEVETMVENIKDTLNSLHQVNVIHSGGSIIEVYETMIARKAKFTLLEGGPEIKYDEVAEGGAQNFILQLLPRTNRKPQITYLKEDSKGRMEVTVVNVPVHHHQFSTNQDTEFNTANVVQVVEDILNQDNSLRKGVIIQEDVNRCAEIIVYSLYNYFDDEDVKSYCPPNGAEHEEPESDRGNVSKTDDNGQRKGAVESTISCLLDRSKDQTCQGLTRPDITVTGNVKLFRSCIEKGDLEYLKSLQVEPEELEQELPVNQIGARQGMELHPGQRDDQAEASDWVPVDVKKLKNMFSGDQKPVGPKPNVCKSLAQSTTSSCTFTGHNEPRGKSESSTDCNVELFSHGQLKNSVDECGPQTQKEACKSSVEPQESFLEMQEDGTIHRAEIIEVVDGNYEIANLQTAIHSLQQATIEAKALSHSSQEKQKSLDQESSKEPVVSGTDGNVRHSKTQGQTPQENANKKEDLFTASNITSEHKSDHGFKSTEIYDEDTNSEKVQTHEICGKMCQKGGTEVFQKAATASVHSSETADTQQEDEEVVFEGKLQAALNSLERSNINVSRGDFRAAMIFRNSSKPHKEMPQNVVKASVQKCTAEEFCPMAEHESTQAPIRQELSNKQVTAASADPPSQSGSQNKAAARASSVRGGRSVCPKPAIPPKPEHLKVKQGDIQSTNARSHEITPNNPQPLPMTSLSSKDEQNLIKINNNANSGTESVALQRNMLSDEAVREFQENEVHQVQGSLVTLESDDTDKNIINRQKEINVTTDKKSSQKSSIKENMSKSDESHVDFHQECKTFGGKKAVKNAPVKPKRVKIAQPDNKYPNHMSGDSNSSRLTHVEQPQGILTGPSCSNTNTCRQTADSKDRHEKETKQEGKVEMREKKGRTETEDERRQRLSVHMDEIMRGNITAAMDIFDNLRKQEELQSILSRVEEIEQDTSEVDVRSLRTVFENVPDWVVSTDKKKHKQVKVENKEERTLLKRDSTENKPSMAHVFGDLERASEEIMNLKEQTLARLMDIEGAIKKALYSVSTLKSDSDIAGLSCLFKESLGTVQETQSSGNISKISIGSSKKKSLLTQERPTVQIDTALPVSQSASIEVTSATQRASPPSSPAFISIQSAARKTDKTELLPTTICPTCQHSPKRDEKFRTTKTLTCNSPAQNRKGDPRKGGQKQSSYSPLHSKRELSVLEVQTDPEGNSVTGSKTVTENYERSDNFGNRVFSSKTSTVVTTQPETTTSNGQAVVSPATYQVTSYPEVRLPINQKP